MSGASPGRRALLKLRFPASPLHVSGRAAMQLGEFYVRGSVTFDRRALCFGQLASDLARHPGHQHALRDLLPFDEECAGRDDRMTPYIRSVEHTRARADETVGLDGTPVKRGVVPDSDARTQR